MCDECKLGDFTGRQSLLDWFGDPCFHDAEVLELKLDREGLSHIRIYAWNTLKETDASGHYILDRQAVVTFTFQRISEIDLKGFGQNVIASLQVQRSENLFRLTLEECVGIYGFIEGTGLAATLSPGEPQSAAIVHGFAHR